MNTATTSPPTTSSNTKIPCQRPTRRDLLDLLQTGRHLASRSDTATCYNSGSDSGDDGDASE